VVEAGDYLIENAGFSPEQTPRLSLLRDNTFIDFNPLGHTLTLRFDMSKRYCKGWYDMTTGASSPCPDQAEIDTKYEQCSICQKRTGFNPAFYHAKSVSPQQEARNLEPHFLYLAYFNDDIIKVGISHAARGNSRLLEQGARSALVLDTFPSAHIARQYEAQIAELAGICETVQIQKKVAALARPHNTEVATKKLAETRSKIEDLLKVDFAKNDSLHPDAIYFPDGLPELESAYDCSNKHMVSGKVIGMLGSLLFCLHQDTPVFLPLKKHVGYRLTLSHSETPIDLPAQQTSLF
jgi:hypothetical protein